MNRKEKEPTEHPIHPDKTKPTYLLELEERPWDVEVECRKKPGRGLEFV